MRLTEFQIRYVLDAAQRVNGRPLTAPPSSLVPEIFYFDSHARARLTAEGWGIALSLSAARVKAATAKVNADRSRLERLMSPPDYSVNGCQRLAEVATRLHARSLYLSVVETELAQIRLRHERPALDTGSKLR